MSRRELHFRPEDEPLRDDVRTLGALVGEVLREQGGEELFADVEAARRAAIRRREDEDRPGDELAALLDGRPAASAELLVRAFATYFRVVNLVEKVHRIRRRRDYLRQGQAQPGSLLATVRRLAEGGLELPAADALFGRLRLEPVFTAHPTEATRRTILRKEQRIARRLVERLDPSRTPPEERAALGRIRAEVTSAWQTEEQPSARPTVADEREHVLFYLVATLYRVVPSLYEALDDACTEVYGAPPQPLPPLVRFASWVGGDMDGNPNVGAATIRETLARQRQLILGRYREELNELYGQLSQSPSRIPIAEQVMARIDGDPQRDEVLAAMPPRHREMPYRVLLTLMYRRLGRTLEDAGGYRSPQELADDLELIATSLAHNRGLNAGHFAVRRMQRRLATFGFHLATLDVRQDAEVHRRVIGRLLADPDWQERPAAERAARLRRVLQENEPPAGGGDGGSQAALEVFRAIDEGRKRYGRHAIGPFVISMAQGVDDVLSVLVLARWAGLEDDAGTVPLDVAPLFETVPDLQAAGEVMAALLADPLYRPHLRSRGDRQMVMIGYSDSNKDGGLASSRWALYRGQQALAQALLPAGVELVVFHGRGGTVSRGGGKTERAVQAMPPGALGGRLRLTEQGETIDAKYGLRGIAQRTLEQMLGAVARATAQPLEDEPREPRWRGIMDHVAAASRRAYRELVYDAEGFYDYFRRATPIDVIERMAIGSRPASRRSRRGLENLRAIPWVFAWTQNRHILPGWYGLGTGLTSAIARHGRDAVAEMARDWPFLRALLDDAEMVLAKADLGIASRYAELAGEEGGPIFERVREEFGRTEEAILELKGNAALLDDDVTLQRAIRLRNPYVDPMSLLQVDLLRRWRAAGRDDDDLLHALFATVRGIAQGLQNTG
ncbi:MAG: phosphoenolpyruvate carboxylase [Acidobacteria bacterium]|nr:MAG: phosphoenolpyruvate carboxylase [Acidobacteriota bacterium]